MDKHGREHRGHAARWTSPYGASARRR